jgi:hypothetical protein
MADLLADGFVRVTFAPSIANTAAPTVAELNAGTRIDTLITPDGLNISFEQATVATAKLSSTFDTEGPGRRKARPELTLVRQTPTDTAWNLLTYGTTGFIVVRRTLDSATAWATSQKVEVYPVQCGQRQPVPPAANEMQKFVISMFVTAPHDDNATVA